MKMEKTSLTYSMYVHHRERPIDIYNEWTLTTFCTVYYALQSFSKKLDNTSLTYSRCVQHRERPIDINLEWTLTAFCTCILYDYSAKIRQDLSDIQYVCPTVCLTLFIVAGADQAATSDTASRSTRNQNQNQLLSVAYITANLYCICLSAWFMFA